eukprot:Phypoly_transcript_01703.p1 GENE.Phypoly_transcript_01703~~Phypoly_transcript_01703.p1  ORF type:complete len:909 (+),score=99.10 Phypoly_transcript_01703:460-3186(+)
MSQPITLAYHCPEYPFKYYLKFVADATHAANFTFVLDKRSSDVSATATSIVNNVRFPNYGYIGFPVTAQCQQLVLDLNFSRALGSYSYADLYYMCRNYDSYGYSCKSANLPVAKIDQGYDASYYHFQFHINCSSVGTYYLYLYEPNYVTYTATWHTGYPCPEGCLNFGTCDLTSGQCNCREDSNTDPMCASKKKRLVDPTVIDLPTDGSAFNYSIALQNAGTVNFKIDNPINASQMVRVNFVVDQRDVWNYMYFNPGSIATSSNRTGGTGIGPGSTGYYTETYLCGATGPWYIFSSVIFAMDIQIIVTLVDIEVITEPTFSGTITTNATSTAAVVYMFQPTNATIVIQVNETTPLLYGITIYSTCGVFQGPDNSQGSASYVSSDYTFGYKQYQAGYTLFDLTHPYYLMVAGSNGAEFVGSLTNTRTASCPAGCSGSAHGFCTPGAFCMCRFGYTGSDCSKPDLPASTPTLVAGLNTLQMTDEPFYNSIIYALASLPAGNAMLVTLSSSVPINVVISQNFPIVTPTSYTLQLKPGTPSVYSFTQCVTRTPTQYYMALAGTTQMAGDVNLTISIAQNQIPIDGTPTAVTYSQYVYVPFIAHLPTNCAKSYYILVESDTNLGTIYVGEGDSKNCMSVSSDSMANIGNDTYYAHSYVLPITNCANSIDLQFYGSGVGAANITIFPTTPCPNNCNGHGQCLLGGTCICDYPYMGTDCGTYDTVCPALPDDQGGTCPSLAPSIYNVQLTNFNNEYCILQQNLNSVKQDLASFSSAIANSRFSASCKDEMRQILCDDIKLRCQTQPGGGIKLMLPCNAMTWQQRCVPPGYKGSFNYLNDVISDINSYTKDMPGFYICNPFPFNYSLYPTPVPSTPAPTISSGTGASTTNNNNNSGATFAFFPIFALVLLALVFVI